MLARGGGVGRLSNTAPASHAARELLAPAASPATSALQRLERPPKAFWPARRNCARAYWERCYTGMVARVGAPTDRAFACPSAAGVRWRRVWSGAADRGAQHDSACTPAWIGCNVEPGEVPFTLSSRDIVRFRIGNRTAICAVPTVRPLSAISPGQGARHTDRCAPVVLRSGSVIILRGKI